ncbi:NTP pyrophosphatase (non-canonical NTP hydrolase) [Kitasatospora sp. MAP12-15]|uniref:MazG-like family protein n=1 Tax=unclassified Kitasatospora TaxID=2633591 RepID=UPI0024745F4B|nr:MazG-like family protein [Kitasatospora sp. MAP12-44]MDH6111435.1 NTP pyrophosphatase (non-canonical NTP hydrolase) [Kitasatospora sp. MAP12-44]
MDQTWEIVNSLAGKLDSYSPIAAGEQRWALLALKLQEESGEVAEAVIGALGLNPRKGKSHTWDDVRRETCDVAVSALVMLARMGGDPQWFFEEHLKGLQIRDLAQEATDDEPATVN